MNDIRQALRAATADCHRRVDDAFAGFDLAKPESYGAFLSAHGRAVPPVEAAVGAGLWPDWRPRAPALQADMAQLGRPMPPPILQPALEQPGRWGALYVLEGSRLGGRLLARRVAPGLPANYLSAGHADGSWQAFQSALEQAAWDAGEAWLGAAIETARAVFETFERAAALELQQERLGSMGDR